MNEIKQDEAPGIFYKYRSLAGQSKTYVLDSLKKKYLYFPTPSEVNDPFDCRLSHDFDASNKEILEWIKYVRRIDKSFEFATVDKVRKHFSVESNRAQFIKDFEACKESFHIFSVSTDCLSEVMWALYAQNYSGICLGYQIINENTGVFFKTTEVELRYGKKDKSVSVFVSLDKTPFAKVNYDNDGTMKINPFRNDNEEKFRKCIFSKKTNWQYENEWRSIYFDDKYPDTPSRCFVYYPDTLLKEVLFGYQISSENKAEIIEIIKENYANFNEIDFFNVGPNLQTYQLEKRKITLS